MKTTSGKARVDDFVGIFGILLNAGSWSNRQVVPLLPQYDFLGLYSP